MTNICEDPPPSLSSNSFNTNPDFLTLEDSPFVLTDTDLDLNPVSFSAGPFSVSGLTGFTSPQASLCSENFTGVTGFHPPQASSENFNGFISHQKSLCSDNFQSLDSPTEDLWQDFLSPLFGLTLLDKADEETSNSIDHTIEDEIRSEKSLQTNELITHPTDFTVRGACNLPLGIDFSPKIIVEDINENFLSTSESANLESLPTSISIQSENISLSPIGKTKDSKNDPSVVTKTKRTGRKPRKKSRFRRKAKKRKPPVSKKRSTENTLELKDSVCSTIDENVLSNETNPNVSSNENTANVSFNEIEAIADVSCNEVKNDSFNETNANVLCNETETGNVSCDKIKAENVSCNEINANDSCNRIEDHDVSCNGMETTDSPSKDSLDPPPAKRRRTYKPRIHIPKTLNFRGRPRKVRVLLTKLPFDPVFEFMKSLSSSQLALNNYNPQDILEYRELLDSNNLQHCFFLPFDE